MPGWPTTAGVRTGGPHTFPHPDGSAPVQGPHGGAIV